LKNYLPREKIAPLIKGTSLENFEFFEDNPQLLKEKLLGEAVRNTPTTPTECIQSVGTVPIDHFFSIKGVGVVILGVVAYGVISKQDTVEVLPSVKTAQIRSIQKHEDEFDCACQGDRVGLALKNVKVEDLERGTVLATDVFGQIRESH